MVDHERVLLLLISKGFQVWVTTLVMVVVFAGKNAFGTAASPYFHVAPATGRIHDSFGRERIFHGLNVVVKGQPWHPRIDAFDPQQSFTDADIVLLKAWGMNLVRLGIMWPGVEPSRGYVNSTYLDVMQSIVSKLHSAGIYTILEFHQDLYASQFCGEGMPSWILDDNYYQSRPPVHVHQRQNHSSPLFLGPLDQNATNEQHSADDLRDDGEENNYKALPALARRTSSSSRLLFSGHQISYEKPRANKKMQSTTMQYLASFPEPLGRRWPWPSESEKDGWEPPVELCNKHSWWLFYLSYAVSRAFQDLYDNKWGWGDLLARYWTVVAGAFKDQPGVLGYELMNEPWPGDVFSNPLLFLPGVADKRNLAPFYEKLQAALRSVDRERILFFETITFDNFRCGFSTVPGGVEWQNKTVLSYHYYTPPNFSAKQAFAERSKESKRLGCGSMLTEFFVSTEDDIGGQQDFRKARKDMLRNAFGAEVLNPKSRADKEAYFCDPAGDGSSDMACGKERRRVSEEDTETMFEADKLSKLRPEEFEPLPVGVKTVVRKAETQGNNKQILAETRAMENDPRTPFAGVENKEQNRAEDIDSVDEVLSEADANVQSWIGWEYKAFFQKTGSIAQQSLFNEDGDLDLVLAKKLGRTYPQSVCGNIVSFSFDPPSSLFSLSFVAGRDCMAEGQVAPTEIFLERDYYYPNGLLVEINPPCASFSETNRIVEVKHTAHCFGYVINVKISRIDPIL